jgi:hypothetical protein
MEKIISSVDPRPPASERGLVPAIVHLGVDVAASGVTTGTAIVNELRSQATSLTVQSLTFVETMVRNLCEAGRRLASEADRASAELTSGGERIALSTLSSVKSAADQAAALATSTVDAVVGRRAEPAGAHN